MCQCCRSPSFWITLLKLVLGITCFIFFTINFSPRNVFDKFCGAFIRASYGCILRKNMAMTACTAFTFIIEPAVIVTHFRRSQQYEESPLGVIFPFIGFLLYTIGGSSTIYSGNYKNYDLGTGSKLLKIVENGFKQITSESLDNDLNYIIGDIIFLVTGIVYLIHMFAVMTRCCRPGPIPYPMVQENHELSTVPTDSLLRV